MLIADSEAVRIGVGTCRRLSQDPPYSWVVVLGQAEGGCPVSYRLAHAQVRTELPDVWMAVSGEQVGVEYDGYGGHACQDKSRSLDEFVVAAAQQFDRMVPYPSAISVIGGGRPGEM